MRSASADCSPPAARGQAVDLAERFAADESPPTPQWRVIEQVTTADLLARAGDDRASVGMLSAALSDAETLHLPHQVQRIIRLTDVAGGLRGQGAGVSGGSGG